VIVLSSTTISCAVAMTSKATPGAGGWADRSRWEPGLLLSLAQG
jgi:hypothetical protein